MLRNKFKNELLEAMKEKDTTRVSTLRLILAAIKDRDLESKRKGNGDHITDSHILDILAKMVKQRNETAKIYEKAGRNELLEAEKEEIRIISDFLPKQMTEKEIRNAVDSTIKETNSKSIKDMGLLMSKLKEKYAGSCDFALVSKIAREMLS